MSAHVLSSTKTLQHLLGAQVLSKNLQSLQVNNLVLDSRKVEKGDTFIALNGMFNNGKNFVCQAVERGANAVLVDAEESAELNFSDTVPVVSVESLSEKLSGLASVFYNNPSKKLSIVGFTGTNGKTSCAQLFAQASALLGMPCGVIGTMGYGVIANDTLFNDPSTIDNHFISTGMTTPDAIETQKILAKFVEASIGDVAIEVSSHGLVQNRVAAVDIDTAVFTNLSHDHLDYHGSMEAYGKAKSLLFSMPSVRSAIINIDDDYATSLLAVIDSSVNIIAYSIQPSSSYTHSSCAQKNSYHFFVESKECVVDGTAVVIVFQHGSGDERIKTRYQLMSPLIGDFNLSNLLAVIASLYARGVAIEDIVEVVPKLRTVAGRMEHIENDQGIAVVVDYAHTPDALKNTLLALKPLTQNKLWCVFGCGGDRDKAKRPVMASISETFADERIVTSDNPRFENPEDIIADIKKGFACDNYLTINDRSDAIHYAVSQAQLGDVILIAGKGHEDYQLVGDKKLFFSDHLQAQDALASKSQQKGARL